MEKDTCDRCIHCSHETHDGFGKYYYCEIDQEYVSEIFALNEELDCDAFVEQNMDDNETEESGA